jgi:hypothetical protein
LTHYSPEMIKIALALFFSFAVAGGAIADTNVALSPSSGGTNAGVALFGFDSSATLTVTGTIYDHAGSSTSLNDGAYPGGGSDDSYGQFNGAYGFIGATFTLSPATQVNSVVFYGSLFGDGGWFGTNGVGPLGSGSTLTALNLVAPTLQYTTNGGLSWVSDSNVTNDYVTQMTGVYAGGASTTPATTFTLTAPLTGIDGIRLIGSNGGYASGGGGFLGGHEIQVFAGAEIPEPSTYAMLALGLVGLIAWQRKWAALRI